MLIELFPRAHARFVALPSLCPLLEGSPSGAPITALQPRPSAGASARHPSRRSCCLNAVSAT